MQSRMFSLGKALANVKTVNSFIRCSSTTAFPSLKIFSDHVEPNGQFAETQAQFLNVDKNLVQEIDHYMEAEKIGIVAHFYMDAEIQGLLAQLKSKNIYIADSLVMGQRACNMVHDGCEKIVCMGVDFMSENCRAQLDSDGLTSTPVYRTAVKPIGCTLADAANTSGYLAYLNKAKLESEHPLHMIYINTSLQVKARCESLVPTITCTSGNVVQLLMQAITQVPNVDIYYGPDSYMGRNLESILKNYQSLSADQLHAINPKLTVNILKNALNHFHYYNQGYCMVHHIFSQQVTNIIENQYPDAYLTSHLEVPTDMFELTLKYKQNNNKGCIGSTADILKYIKGLMYTEQQDNLDIILGTEAGMVCSIIKTIQAMLKDTKSKESIKPRSVNIIFPVSNDAVLQTKNSVTPIVPGSHADGCSIHGSCATCPFMKMNSIDSLQQVMKLISMKDTQALEAYKPQVYNDKINGIRVQELGSIPINRMRQYQSAKELPQTLVDAINKH